MKVPRQAPLRRPSSSRPAASPSSSPRPSASRPSSRRRPSPKSLQAKAEQVKALLLANFDKPSTELVFSNLYELLVCVMLSAQCTDKRVNLITPGLFAAYPDLPSLAAAKLTTLKGLIASCSFFNTKAQNLIKMAQAVCENFAGEIPLDEAALQSLAGVGQKTAHVVLIEWCGANLMAVDTHVFRVAHRLGLARGHTPAAVEEELTTLFRDHLNYLHQALVLFGRYHCQAKRPSCEECFLAELCDFRAAATTK